MMPTIRYCTLIVLLAGMVGVLVGCAGKGTRKTATETPAEKPAATLNDVNVTVKGGTVRFPDSGPRIWVLKAHTIRGNASGGAVTLEQVSCELRESERVMLAITADSAHTLVKGKTSHLTLQGHVHARRVANGQELWAERLQWQSDATELRGTGMRLRGLGVEHRADRGVVTTDLTQATFDGNVRTQTIGAQAP